MSEEIETTDIVTDTITPEEFDFYALMSGAVYPKDTVTVTLDESAAYDALHIAQEFDEFRTSAAYEEDPESDEVKAKIADFEARIEAVKNRVNENSVTFDLTGVSDELIESAKASVDEQFEDKRKQRKLADGSLQKYIPDDVAKDYLRMLNATVFSLQIERMRFNKVGAEFVAPDPDKVAHFFDTAPRGSKMIVANKIMALSVDAQSLVNQMDEGFFPKS